MVSNRIQQTHQPPLVNLGALAARTTGCISLGQGVPYYQPDEEFMINFASSINNSEFHRYTPDQGIPELRTKIAHKFEADNQLQVDPSQIIVTNGANQAFVNVLLTLCDPGDRVALITPYYFNHQMACEFSGIQTDFVNMGPNFILDEEAIEKSLKKKPKALVLVNPGNPTGHVLSNNDISLLSDLLENTNTILISDETYEYFTYNGTKHITAASNKGLKDKTITLGTFSKTYGIPGWRLGYYIGAREILDESVKIQDTTTICAPAPAQYLGLRLLENRDIFIPKFVSLMENNHKIAKDLLEEVSWLQASNSMGAYYLFPKQTTGINTEKLANNLITQNKVAVVPGQGFGEYYKDHVRISFANVHSEQLKDAFSRLKQAEV